MRVKSVVLFALALAAVVASAAVAQTVCVPSETATVPPVTDQAAVMPTVPAGLGAGPVNQIALIPEGQGFDSRFIQLSFQQHSDVACLAQFGAQRATDRFVRELSQKMVNERTDLNRRLTNLNAPFECLGCLQADQSRCNQIQQSLEGLCGCEFDRAYAQAMTVLLEQENRLANEGTVRTTGALRDYANRAKRTSYNEANWFSNFVQTGSATCPAPCPPVGAGPICPEPCPPAATPCPAPCPPVGTGPVCPPATTPCPGTCP